MVSIAHLKIRKFRTHFQTMNALFQQSYFFCGAKSQRFCAHFHTAHNLSYMSHLNFEADFSCCLWQLHDVGRAFTVILQLWS